MPADVALVTGASTDTGYHIAHRLCAHGHPVILVGAVENELDWIAAKLVLQGAEVRAITCDMENGYAPQQLFDEIAADDIDVGILANNTGLTRANDIAAFSMERHFATLRIHAEVALGMTALLLPGMLARGRGHILNLVSTTRYASALLRNACDAANASMLSWSDSLASRVEGTPVNVTAFLAQAAGAHTRAQRTTAYAIARAAYDERATREYRIVVDDNRAPALPRTLVPEPALNSPAGDLCSDSNLLQPANAGHDAALLYGFSR